MPASLSFAPATARDDAPTDPLVERLDQLQSEFGKGPCYDTEWSGQTLIRSDLAEDDRWPATASEVTTLGIYSLLATEL